MQARIDTAHVSPDACKAMRALQSYVDATNLEKSLRELVKIRASQINGCAFCLHMHTRDACKAGESQERLDLLNAWREAPGFTTRERAALAWTEAVTLVADSHVPDDVAGQPDHGPGGDQPWNRLMVAFRIPPAVAGNR